MCGTCCKGFLKAMDDTNFIPNDFWYTDDIYRTMHNQNCPLHGVFPETVLPCCETWEQVRTYNELDIPKACSSDLMHDICLYQKGKTKRHNRPYQYTVDSFEELVSLDGALIFPSYHVLVPGYIGMPQTHILGRQGDFLGEDGIPHAVIDPITAKNIDMEEFYHSEKTLNHQENSRYYRNTRYQW